MSKENEKYKQYKENKYYKKYIIQKEKIVKKYPDLIDNSPPRPGRVVEPPQTVKERNRYRKYLKEIGDLLMKPGGNYQKFVWDIMSEGDKIIQERNSRGRAGASPYYFM